MTIVSGAVASLCMGNIADTTASIAISFLIPLVCYGVIGGYALLKPSAPLSQKEFFGKRMTKKAKNSRFELLF